ncbi:MAG: hypothetical protein ABSB30_07060 [Terracidiphilus sp.]
MIENVEIGHKPNMPSRRNGRFSGQISLHANSVMPAVWALKSRKPNVAEIDFPD